MAEPEPRQQEVWRRPRLAEEEAPPWSTHPGTGRPVGSWEHVPGAVGATAIAQASAAHIVATAGLSIEQSLYGGEFEAATRTYIADGEVDSGEKVQELLGPIFEPLIALVQRQLETRCACKLQLENAFATLYTTRSKGNRGHPDHRDFDSFGRFIAASAVLQGHTACGFEGGGLLMRTNADGSPHVHDDDDDRQEAKEGRVEGVRGEQIKETRVLQTMEPGDLLLLFGAFHEARPIVSGKRLSFVFFFHEQVNSCSCGSSGVLE